MIVTQDPSITKKTDQTVILSDGEIIDQTVARALPLLSHPQMLAATYKAKKQVYSPNATILRQGEPVDHFFMFVEGEVEVVDSSAKCNEMGFARLGPGQFFGEVELTCGGNSIASVRAASDRSIELVLLPKEEFNNLLENSRSTQEALEQVARSRLSENQDQLERNY